MKKFCSLKLDSLGIVGLRIHWRIRSSFWSGLNGDQFVLSFVAIPVRNKFLAFCHPVFPSAVLICSKVMSLFGLPLANNGTKHLGIFLGLFFAICRAGVQLWVCRRAAALPTFLAYQSRAMHFRLCLLSMVCIDPSLGFREFMQLLHVSVVRPCCLKFVKEIASSFAAPNISEHVVHVYNAGFLDVQPRFRHSLHTKA